MTAHRWIAIGSVAAFIAVVLGAFAAHGLYPALASRFAGSSDTVLDGLTVPLPHRLVQNFRTAANYQMTHALGIVALGLWGLQRPLGQLGQIAGICFLAGILIFCGSLYFLALTNVKWLGAITPIGGIFFLLGWAAFAILAWRTRG